MTSSKYFADYPAVWVIDTEFQAPDGEQNRPVCLCARDQKSGREVELFFDQPAECPFDLQNDLFICYNASAEWKTFLALCWGTPEHIVDLYFEFLNLINGVWLPDNSASVREVGTGLLAALQFFGRPQAIKAAEKDEERDYINANGVVPPEGVSKADHQSRIIGYCWTDVDATELLFLDIFPDEIPAPFEEAL
jgi:DNA polymerase I